MNENGIPEAYEAIEILCEESKEFCKAIELLKHGETERDIEIMRRMGFTDDRIAIIVDTVLRIPIDKVLEFYANIFSRGFCMRIVDNGAEILIDNHSYCAKITGGIAPYRALAIIGNLVMNKLRKQLILTMDSAKHDSNSLIITGKIFVFDDPDS